MPGQNSKLKFAVCVSGETRSWNRVIKGTIPSHEFGLDYFVRLLRSHGHTVDVFGHTWDHCQAPVESDTLKLENVIISNQDTEIGDWLREDIFNRLVLHNRKIDTLIPKDRSFADGNHEKFLESLVYSGKAAWGQYFSNALCIEQVNTTEYDAIIRWRWDVMMEVPDLQSKIYNSFEQDMFFLTRYAMNSLVYWADPEVDNLDPTPNLLLTGNSFETYHSDAEIESNPEDIVFAIKPKTPFISSIKQGTWRDDIANMNADLRIYDRVCSHSLWAHVFRWHRLTAWCGLPNVFFINRPKNR